MNMRRGLYFFFFLIVTINTRGQQQLPAGLYAGGLFEEALEGSGVGQWMIFEDGSFRYFRFSKDFLVSIGSGTWTMKDSVIRFHFLQSSMAYKKLYPSIRKYESSLKSDIDSIYISGLIKTEDGKPIDGATVFLNPKIQTSTGKDGTFNYVLSTKDNRTGIFISSPNGVYNYSTQLDDHANFHKFELIFPSNTSNYYEPFWGSEYENKITLQTKDFSSIISVYKFGYSKVRNMLEHALTEQPWIAPQIKSLLRDVLHLEQKKGK